MPACRCKANGPFGPGMLGYLEDSGYPTYDPEPGQGGVRHSASPSSAPTRIEFTFNTTNDPFNVESNTLIISMWQEVLGDAVQATITPIEQGQYIGLALTGTFKAFGWRNHGGIDPATQAYWWQSTSSAPIGSLALNFGRFKDPDMDAALDDGEERARSGGPQGRRRGGQPHLRRAGVQPLALTGPCGASSSSRTSTASRATSCRRRRRRRPRLLRASPDEPDLVRRRHVRMTS